ncbi:unnamed protein product [Adineta ricciae]|uniref:Uncharacterized protein n=1 Tax=Adineta ricciae TaxID=249248 RepID=A0A814XD74_ADIRI|nr:unnamed protein product [Adineta ricciae]
MEYASPYIPVVPRILPSQNPSKIFPVNEDPYSHQYLDNYSPSTHVNPTINSYGPLSTRAQLNQHDLSPVLSNHADKIKNKKGVYHEPLKDNSGDFYPNGYPYRSAYDQQYRSGNYYDYPRMDSFERNPLQCSKAIIITFGAVIGLFALTALTISIYLLVRFSTWTSS